MQALVLPQKLLSLQLKMEAKAQRVQMAGMAQMQMIVLAS